MKKMNIFFYSTATDHLKINNFIVCFLQIDKALVTMRGYYKMP